MPTECVGANLAPIQQVSFGALEVQATECWPQFRTESDTIGLARSGAAVDGQAQPLKGGSTVTGREALPDHQTRGKP